MTPDLINGLFEVVGSLMIWLNVRQIYRDKEIKGVHVAPTAFFFTWGLWNLYYYPHLNQWLSFAGGISIAIANGFWVGLMIYYGRKQVK
jgi:hypothetical protein